MEALYDLLHASGSPPEPGAVRTSRHEDSASPSSSLNSVRQSWYLRQVLVHPPLRAVRRGLLVISLLTLVLFTSLIAPWPVMQPSVAFAQALRNPNPALGVPSWLSSSFASKKPDLNQSTTPAPGASANVKDNHPWQVSMKSARLALSTAAQTFTSSDGQLEVDVPANSLDATQVAGTPGGIQLYISQVKPASGRTDNGGFISLGTYEFQFFDGTGKPLSTIHLLHPLTVHLRLPANQQMVWSGQQVYTLWNAVKGSSTPPTIASPDTQPATSASGTAPATGSAQVAGPTSVAPQAVGTPILTAATGNNHGLDWSVQSSLAAPATTPTSGVTPGGESSSLDTRLAGATSAVAAAASTIAYNTQAPQATWGTPTTPQVGLNSGGLNYNYPLSIPPGPGGFQPDVQLAYSSGSVDESYGWQSAAPWVGEGWSLDLGSISWAQENVTPNGTATLENVWHISDPSGIGGQLIPPDLTYTTQGTLNPSATNLANNSNVYIWQTAPESHAKVREIAFGGIPCWRVYLPNGTLEEFGCTNDSRESYVDSSGNVDPYSWKLDLMIDRFGNQVHISYQRQHISNGYVEDAVLSDITYDDSTCHNTTTACSTWNPAVDIHFDASQSVTNLLNSGCGSGTSTTRCDDPVDLTSSGGLAAPKVMSAYVLNDVKVEVQGNILHEYVFSYSQKAPGTLGDPNTGKNESLAGYLLLGKIQEEGTGGTSLNAPVTTISYTEMAEHYSDLFSYSDNGVGDVCNNSYSAAPRDGSSTGPCYLWGQTHNRYYISTLDNGRGWHENVSWAEAHDNAWGTDGGTNYNNALQCNNAQTSTNVCGWADDKNWSRIVVTSRTTVSNGVSSTWSYSYYLTTVGNKAGIPGTSSRACNGACESYDWGNQNDDDYADYYNGDFQSFQKVQVTMPDGSSQTDIFDSTNGWGLYSSSITCYTGGTCYVEPYNQAYNSSTNTSGPVLAGKQRIEQDYNSSGALMKEIDTSWSTNCPPAGVSGSVHAAGGTSDPGTSYLFSELDHNNPVMVCDPRETQTDTYLTDGVTSTLTDPRVVHTTSTTSYDGNSCGSTGYDYGNVTRAGQTANDVGGASVYSISLFCPNDSISSGVYLTDLPIKEMLEDANGIDYGCHVSYYNGSTNYQSQPTAPSVTRVEDHAGYSAAGNGCAAPGSMAVTLHTYDASGNSVTGTDPDTHLGCTSGSAQYSACATYDSFAAHLHTGTNAENQTTTYAYTTGAASSGYGEWLMSETDENGQTTSYQYDALGRLTAIVRPGDSAASPSVIYTYINNCSAGSTTPCLEIDTATRFTVGGSLSTAKAWYDGWGNQVETQTPGPNASAPVIVTYTVYDKMGHATIKSLPYAVASASGYLAPDLTQPRTVTSYDSEGRSLGVVTYSDAITIVQLSSISYTVAQGVPTLSSESSSAYERTTTLDAYGHQSITYADGLGRTRYMQVFSGTTSPYTVVRTVGKTYDTPGNVLSTVTYDGTGAVAAGYYASYDGLKELLGYNDSDLGSCADTPLPASCSSSTDLAWKYTYDLDGNSLSQTDPRNQTIYRTYDALDRPLCRALTPADASSCSGTTDTIYFYDAYSNASTPGANFPSGCAAPSGSYASDPVGKKTAEIFIGTSGAGSGWRCYGYDARGQTDQSTLSVTTPDAGSVTQTVNTTYNDAGEVTGLVYPDGETLTSTYDVSGRLQSIYFGTSSSTDPVPFLVGAVSYTNAGQVSGMAMGGSAAKTSAPTTPVYSTSTSYDAIQRPLSDAITEAGTTIWSQTRTYDNVSNILGLSTVIPTSSGGSATENESFCYDALNRLAWAGNSGMPTGGDHCMAPPTGTTLTTYSQSYGYDSLDRLTSGPAGTYTYGDANQVHAVTGVSSVPNQYASYDAMGNMTCRNVDITGGQTCVSGSPTGATMNYDAYGQMTNWTAPSSVVGSAHYLYDAEGNRVLVNSTNASTTTDTISFDSYTETVLSGGVTTISKYYSANGARVAVRVGSTLSYLMSDPLGSNSVALNSTGQVIGFQHYSPYGTGDYSWGTMPTTYNYAGERLDSQTGLLYDNFRYYDPVTGRFVRSDDTQDNATGMDPYAYVGDNPETRNDPTGHCWPWCTALVGAAIGAAISVGITVAKAAIIDHKPPSLGEVLGAAASGAVSGAIIGVLGPGASLGAAVGIGALAGGLGGAAGGALQQATTNIATKGLGHVGDGVLEAAGWGGLTGAVTGALTAGAFKGLGGLISKSPLLSDAVDGLKNSLGTKVGDLTGLAGRRLGDWLDRIPSYADRQPFGTNNAIKAGIKFSWTDGGDSYVSYAHSTNASAPAGSNSASGWTYRLIRNGTDYMDNFGNWISGSAGNFSNSTHIPIARPWFLFWQQ